MMSTQHSPPESNEGLKNQEIKLNKVYTKWRKTVMKITTSRIRILRVLADDGNVRAQELLGEPVQSSLLVRCQKCPGCRTFNEDKRCGRCQECLARKECAEYQRLCFTWERTANSFHDESSASGVSSHFDLAESDLSKYHDLVENLRDLSMDLEDAVDEFPASQNRTKHPRYGDERIDKTLENEEILLTLVDDLVAAQVWLRERLREVEEEIDND